MSARVEVEARERSVPFAQPHSARVDVDHTAHNGYDEQRASWRRQLSQGDARQLLNPTHDSPDDAERSSRQSYLFAYFAAVLHGTLLVIYNTVSLQTRSRQDED